MLKVLKSLCAVLVAVQPAIERAMSAEEIRQYAVEAGINVVQVVPSIADAMQFVLASNQAVLVVGSFYVVDEALAELQARQIPF
jgi:folylpolyglutamate synthase/dihydropteroate synthase